MLRRFLFLCLGLGALGLACGPRPAGAATSVTVVPKSAADTFTYPFDIGIDRTFTVSNTGDTTQAFSLTSRIVNDAGMAHGIVLQTPFGGPRSLELAPGESKILRLQLSFPEVTTTAWLTGKHFEMPVTIELAVSSNFNPPVTVYSQTFPNHIVVGIGPVNPSGMQTNATIAGTIRDADTGKRIKNARIQAVSAQGNARSAETASGVYSLPAFAWRRVFLGTNIEYTVIVSAPGYAEQHRLVTPEPGATTKLDFSLRKPVTTGSYSIAAKYDTGLPPTYTDFSDDGRYLATVPFHSGLDAGYIAQHAYLHFFDTSTRQLLWRFPLGREVTGIDVSDDGSLVATYRPEPASPNPGGGSVLLFDRAGNLVHEYPIPQTTWDVMQVGISHDKRFVAYGTLDGRFGLLDRDTGAKLWERDTGAGQVRTITFDTGDTSIFVGSGDGNVYRFDMQGHKLWSTYIGSWATNLPVSAHYVFAGGKAGEAIYVLDKPTGAVVWSYPVDAKPDDLAISPDETRFVYCNSAAGALKFAVFDQHGTLLWGGASEGACRGATVSADGKYVLSTDGKNIAIDLLATGERVWSGASTDPPPGYSTGDGFAWIAPDGSRFITGAGNSPYVYFWTGGLQHARRISLAVSRKVATGRVRVPDGFAPCLVAGIAIQRRAGGWKTVAHATSGADGAFRVALAKMSGRYRAVAAASHGCLAATSG